jgi:nicotinamide mononucleotide (NMN) deamidase PncC
MDSQTRQLIEALHGASHQLVFAATGGGATAAALLLGVSGASRTVLEVVVPYHEQALIDFLGHAPEQFCSTATSQVMAQRALLRAHQLAPAGQLIGVGCTASLATDRPKRGEHRFHLTLQSDDRGTTYSLVLCKGARDREGEEAVLDAVLLNALADMAGISQRVPSGLFSQETLQIESTAGDLLSALVRGEIDLVCVLPDGRLSQEELRPVALLPGSFNPVHDGHWQLAELAAVRLGGPVGFELSVVNVDKPPLTVAEIRRRVHQFAWRSPVWLTRAPTFVQKAALFPGVHFLVGFDTATRIVAPRYYQDSEARMAEALQQMDRLGCRFLVAGREGAQGRFGVLADVKLPEAYCHLFSGLSQAEFHVPLSSTALRRQAEKDKNVAPGGPPQ